MSPLRPHGMDFSETGEFPAVVEVVLIRQLSEWTLRDEQARHERELTT